MTEYFLFYNTICFIFASLFTVQICACWISDQDLFSKRFVTSQSYSYVYSLCMEKTNKKNPHRLAVLLCTYSILQSKTETLHYRIKCRITFFLKKTYHKQLATMCYWIALSVISVYVIDMPHTDKLALDIERSNYIDDILQQLYLYNCFLCNLSISHV